MFEKKGRIFGLCWHASFEKLWGKILIYVSTNKHKILLYQKYFLSLKLFWKELILSIIKCKFSFLQYNPVFLIYHFCKLLFIYFIFKTKMDSYVFFFCLDYRHKTQIYTKYNHFLRILGKKHDILELFVLVKIVFTKVFWIL